MKKITLTENLFRRASTGTQPKWHIGNTWYKADDFNHEGLAETIVSEILKKSNLPLLMNQWMPNKEHIAFATYSTEMIEYSGKQVPGCKSENFLKDDDQLIESIKLLRQNDLENMAKTYAESIKDVDLSIKEFVETMTKLTGLKDFDQYLTAMFELDKITLNPDRHFGNIAVLRRNGEFLYAPVFDNGRAFALNDKLWDRYYPAEAVIEHVDALPFCDGFNSQTKKLEELSKNTYFRTSFGKDDLRRVLNAAAIAYADDILYRAEQVFDIQMERNLQYFIGPERSMKNQELLQYNDRLPNDLKMKEEDGELYISISPGVKMKIIDEDNKHVIKDGKQLTNDELFELNNEAVCKLREVYEVFRGSRMEIGKEESRQENDGKDNYIGIDGGMAEADAEKYNKILKFVPLNLDVSVIL